MFPFSPFDGVLSVFHCWLSCDVRADCNKIDDVLEFYIEVGSEGG